MAKILVLKNYNMKENYEATLNYIRELLNQSEIIDNDEKKYWNDILGELTEEQLRKLINIIVLDQKDKIQEFNKLMMIDYEEIWNNKWIS